MNVYICRVQMPKGYENEKRNDVEKIIERAITILNSDIKVDFALFYPNVKWYSLKKDKKTLDKE